ncbi:hypothetical protein EBU99_08365 [bacterium]|nr:hypothetical protein [bacterium]
MIRRENPIETHGKSSFYRPARSTPEIANVSVARPAISDERVIIEGPASIRIKLKSAWADGTHSLLFTPSEFLERLVALIPAPKFHTTRYYGVLASRSPDPLGTASQAHIQNRCPQV